MRGWRWRCSKRWRERSSCWEPENPPLFLLLSRLLPSFLKKISPPLYFLSFVLFLLSLPFFFFVFLLFYLASVFYSFLPSLVSLPSLSLPSLLLQNFAPSGFPFFRFCSLPVFPCSFLFFLFCPSSSPLKQTLPSVFCSAFCPKIVPLFLFVSLPLFISRKRRSPPCSVPSWCRGKTGCLTCAG